MKHLYLSACVVLTVCITLISCKKEGQPSDTPSALSEEALTKIKALGFGTNGIQKIPEGYLVEGDIILTENDLSAIPESPALRIAEEEQYRTNNLVTSLPRTIAVNASSCPASIVTALDAAIARYNALNLRLKFSRVTSGGNIRINMVTTNSYIASAGFPSGGNPYGTINYSTTYQNYSNSFITTVLAHEMGHCIGFRHTDYMRRSYSCGSGGNEGGGTIGAILIPGTPSGPDARSWMLACLSSSTDRPFNSNDIIALNFLYK